MTTSKMKDVEHFLYTTYCDQGGECSFFQWVEYVAEDEEEFAHEEAKDYFEYCKGE